MALPLLGPICDGFDDWLVDNGYTYESRRCAIHMLPHVDAGLRRHHSGDIASLAHPVFHACWRDLMKVFPNGTGTVRSLERYLITTGMVTAGLSDTETTTSAAVVLSDEYVDHLREVRGFAGSTVSHHRYSSRCFLDYLEAKKVPLDSIQARDVEAYISQISKRLCRASLQHDIAAVRGLLRFLATDGRAPIGVDRQIDTPRLYQMEKLPRSLPWDTVIALLKSIDTASAMGLRDYAMILLIATYGLRASEVVAVTLDDIRWRQGNLRIQQRKTSSPLELPLTNEVSAAIVKHLKRTPPPRPISTELSQNARPDGFT
jgi:hypothetical protein